MTEMQKSVSKTSMCPVCPFEVRRRVRVKPNENVQSRRATPIHPVRPELTPEVS